MIPSDKTSSFHLSKGNIFHVEIEMTKKIITSRHVTAATTEIMESAYLVLMEMPCSKWDKSPISVCMHDCASTLKCMAGGTLNLPETASLALRVNCPPSSFHRCENYRLFSTLRACAPSTL